MYAYILLVSTENITRFYWRKHAFVPHTLRGFMQSFIPKALVIITFFMILGLITFIGGQILTLSEFAAVLHPMLGTIIFTLGAATFGLSILWLLFRYMMRPKALILKDNPSEEDIKVYATTLVSRLKSSPIMKAYAEKQKNYDAINNEDENFQPIHKNHELSNILGYLDDEAMRETRRTASRIFLATAISRNGRLDTLIVLVLLIRLVWRVSHIYNQRPHPRHMLRLYVNVASTALAAGALEDVGLEEHIHALLTPMLAAGPVSSVPTMSGLGTMLGSALVDGSANALLALRVGIVTRNMLSPTLPHMQARLNPYREAATILGQMSKGLVSKVVRTAVHAMGNGVKNTACNAAKNAYASTKNAYTNTKTAAQGVMSGVATTFCDATKIASSGVDVAAKVTRDGVNTAARATADTANYIVNNTSVIADISQGTIADTANAFGNMDIPQKHRAKFHLPKLSLLFKKK